MRAIWAIASRALQAAGAMLADTEDEVRHMGEPQQWWIVAGAVAVVALIAVLMGLN